MSAFFSLGELLCFILNAVLASVCVHHRLYGTATLNVLMALLCLTMFATHIIAMSHP